MGLVGIYLQAAMRQAARLQAEASSWKAISLMGDPTKSIYNIMTAVIGLLSALNPAGEQKIAATRTTEVMMHLLLV